MTKKSILLVAVLLFASTLLNAESADSVVGKWYTEGNESIVQVYKVGSTYYGKIIWLKDEKDDQGHELLDKRNPDESKQQRKIIGLVIMRNFEYKGENKWEEGNIYDPESGKTYSCILTLNGNHLDVRGYIGIAAIGRTSRWNRAD